MMDFEVDIWTGRSGGGVSWLGYDLVTRLLLC